MAAPVGAKLRPAARGRGSCAHLSALASDPQAKSAFAPSKELDMTSYLGHEFVGVPRHLRERRCVSWAAKAVACHLRFRQGTQEEVCKPARELGKDLGLSLNAVLRAIQEAIDKGLLRPINLDWRQGQARIFDARAVDAVESDSEVESLPRGRKKRTRPGVTSDSASESPKRTRPGVTSAPDPESPYKAEAIEDEEVKEREQDARLLSLSFPAGPTEKQRKPMLNTIAAARQCGVPPSFLAHALTSKKVARAEDKPWKRLDYAINMSKKIVEMLNALQGKQFDDLQHVVDYVTAFGAEGDGLPKTFTVDGKKLKLDVILSQCMAWPASCPATGGGA